MPTPLEVYNKRIKKREREKRKNDRIEARNIAKLLQEPEKLKQELDELSHKAIIGRIDPEALQRKEKLEKIWNQHKSTQKYTPVPAPAAESSNTSSDSSSDSSSDYSDESPKCIIEIAGEPKEKIKRGFHDPDPPDVVALEPLTNVPSLATSSPTSTSTPTSTPLELQTSLPPGPPPTGPPPIGPPSQQTKPLHNNKRGKFMQSGSGTYNGPGVQNGPGYHFGKRGGMARPGGSKPPPPPPIGGTQAQRSGKWESLGHGTHLERAVPPPPSHGPVGSGSQSGSSKADSNMEKPAVPMNRYFVPTQLRLRKASEK